MLKQLIRTTKPTIIIISLLSLLVVSCGPQYRVVDDYVPPADNSGKRCLKQCQKEKNRCQRKCTRKRQHCLADAEMLAKDDYPQAMDHYANELEKYTLAQDLYQHKYDHYRNEKDWLNKRISNLKVDCREGDRHACKKRKNLIRKRNHLHQPARPLRPFRPTLVSITKEYQEACKSDCGCDENFRSCYIGCGGQVKSRSICVENCDQAK